MKLKVKDTRLQPRPQMAPRFYIVGPDGQNQVERCRCGRRTNFHYYTIAACARCWEHAPLEVLKDA